MSPTVIGKCTCNASRRYVLSPTGWKVTCMTCRAEWLERFVVSRRPELEQLRP